MPLYLRSDDDPLLKAIQDSTAVKKGDDYHYLPQRARNEHRNYNVLQSLRYALKKKTTLFGNFSQTSDPPPHSPLLGTPYPKKNFSVYFAF